MLAHFCEFKVNLLNCFERPEQRLRISFRGSLAAEVAGPGIRVRKHRIDGGADGLRMVWTAHIIQHHAGGEQQGGRIGNAFAGNVRSGTVNGFKYSILAADLRTRHDAEAADQAADQITQNIPVEIRHDQHIVVFRIDDKLHAHVVNDAAVRSQVRILRCDFLEDVQEKAVRQLQNVRLVHAGDALAGMRPCVFEGGPDDALTGSARNLFDCMRLIR